MKTIEYYPDPITAFNDGCLLDLKFRSAMQMMELLMSSGKAMEMEPANVAAHVLNISEELFSQGKARGWIEDLPESGDINSAMRRHLERAVKAQLYQQQVAQREQNAGLRPVRPIMNG